MEFLPGPQHPPGPATMDLEEPKGPEMPSEDHPSNSQWALGPRGPDTLSEMELDASGVRELVQQLEALPSDLGGPFSDGAPCPLHIATGQGLATQENSDADPTQTAPRLLQPPEDHDGDPGWMEGASAEPADSRSSSSSPEPWLETAPLVTHREPPVGTQVTSRETLASCPAVSEVPGPCGQEELMDGVVFAAKYLGSTQLLSERSPPPSTRMGQAQEAMDRVKAPEGETQPMVEVDIFVSTKRVKVLAADSQDALMDHALQTISYIADIGPVLVLMARRRLARRTTPQDRQRRLYKMLCHVFHSEDAQLIAQAIGQAFSIAYSQFLQENKIDPSQVGTQPSAAASHPHNGDLDHFCNSQNCREVCIQKRPGEALGVALVESGWGSLLPTAVIANLLHGGPAERCGALSIGDRVTAINGTSLVGLSLAACQAAVREVRRHSSVTLSIIHCPPVTTAVIRRPHVREQLGFCVEDGIICSLLRGGAAERGGVRVGHRIIEVNGQSVVATPHARIIQLLTETREIHIKTMPAATYRLLTGQEQPVYL
ncbi:amyloid-beta A4 precursor protein-binding family A member 3 isoform X4 [Arvicanthis niloticus]|uniref:amyloid-beta A4 precursor protein-binding family A member 3 isoform X4 n=1 Tax=Arvicanthis niloticus TaxID=61156 RepID=UPI001485D13D|nr:amyloid-beta A4 precursor protein-binding family A member 3 isoform X4 [Arvicanthis niloticus]